MSHYFNKDSCKPGDLIMVNFQDQGQIKCLYLVLQFFQDRGYKDNGSLSSWRVLRLNDHAGPLGEVAWIDCGDTVQFEFL